MDPQLTAQNGPDPQHTEVLPRQTKARPSIGRRYEVLDLLVESDDRRLYRAWDHDAQQLVALEALDELLPKSRQQEYVRAAGAVAALPVHPNVLAVLEVPKDSVPPVSVLQYLEGETLGDFMNREGPITVEQAFRVSRQIAQGLNFIHHYGLVHGAVTPQSILMTQQGPVKLIGINGMRTSEQMEDRGYRAPETRAGGGPTPASDIYGLGAVVYALVSGAPPEPEELDPRRINPELDPAAADIIRRALEGDPETRYATAGAFATAMGKYLTQPREHRMAASSSTASPLTTPEEHTAVLPKPNRGVGSVDRPAREEVRARTIGFSSLLFLLVVAVAGAGGWYAYRAIHKALGVSATATVRPNVRHPVNNKKNKRRAAPAAAKPRQAACPPAGSGDVTLTTVYAQEIRPRPNTPDTFDYTLSNRTPGCRSVALLLTVTNSLQPAQRVPSAAQVVRVRSGSSVAHRQVIFPATTVGNTFDITWTVTDPSGAQQLGISSARRLVTVAG